MEIGADSATRAAAIVAMREAPGKRPRWRDIGAVHGITGQRARYIYQVAKERGGRLPPGTPVDDETLIAGLDLPQRTMNACATARLVTVRDVRVMSDRDLRRLDGIGDLGLRCLRAFAPAVEPGAAIEGLRAKAVLLEAENAALRARLGDGAHERG